MAEYDFSGIKHGCIILSMSLSDAQLDNINTTHCGDPIPSTHLNSLQIVLMKYINVWENEKTLIFHKL